MKENIVILEILVQDVRFPTSRSLDGSDAMNLDPDYSATYVILKTNLPSLEGHGLTFTIGRGNEICVEAVKALAPLIKGKSLGEFTQNMGDFWKMITGVNKSNRYAVINTTQHVEQYKAVRLKRRSGEQALSLGLVGCNLVFYTFKIQGFSFFKVQT